MRVFPNFDDFLQEKLQHDLEFRALYLPTALEDFHEDGDIYYLALAIQHVANVQEDAPIWLKELSVGDIETRLGSANTFSLNLRSCLKH